MNVQLLAHTQLSNQFVNQLLSEIEYLPSSSGQAVALTAIRTCYSHNKPSEILQLEHEKYFGRKATDGKTGTEADRLIRHIFNSGHSSTLEHLTFTFAVEGVSRSLLAQLTRHRHLSFSVQSQRYVKLESESKSGGFDYIVPESVKGIFGGEAIFKASMKSAQTDYDILRASGVPAEDARAVLPNATTCNLVLTGNLRSLLDLYSKRSAKGAQWEIRELAERIKDEVVKVEKWTGSMFGGEE